jgi:hypothetical protein
MQHAILVPSQLKARKVTPYKTNVPLFFVVIWIIIIIIINSDSNNNNRRVTAIKKSFQQNVRQW